jgi:hypothetical protein
LKKVLYGRFGKSINLEEKWSLLIRYGGEVEV